MSIAFDARATQASDVSAAAVRARIRRGEYRGQTSGLAPGMVQGNVAILPADWADEFLRFCLQNPKPCPVLAVGKPGDPMLPTLGRDIDIRTDVPRYRVFRDGKEVDSPTDLMKWWRDDLVAFVLGCSFSFEQALLDAGLRLRHLEQGVTVSMFRTSLDTERTERFHGKLVVSMRPFTPAEAIRAVQITSRFPNVHGAPVHLGLPEMIGIKDIAKPDYGDAVAVGEDELPVFWACGVTPQSEIATAKPPFSISHYPSHMLITDLLNAKLAAL